MNTPTNDRLATWLSVPWSSFVAAFLYYTALTTLLLGGISPQTAVVAVSYLAPMMAYVVFVGSRLTAVAARAMPRMPHSAPRLAAGHRAG